MREGSTKLRSSPWQIWSSFYLDSALRVPSVLHGSVMGHAGWILALAAGHVARVCVRWSKCWECRSSAWFCFHIQTTPNQSSLENVSDRFSNVTSRQRNTHCLHTDQRVGLNGKTVRSRLVSTEGELQPQLRPWACYGLGGSCPRWRVKWKPCGCSWLNLIWMVVEKWSCLVVSDSLRPMDSSPPSSSVHGILQARILEWVAIMYSWPLKYVWVVGQLSSQSKIYI